MRPVARLLQERQGQQAASAGPCFAPLFGNASLSDIDVLIQEEEVLLQAAASTTAKQPAAAAVTLPANVAVLYSLSEFVRNKVDNWSDEQQQGQRRQLLLLVPPGQVSTGRLLVEAMYMDAPDLSHLALGELLALLALADSYSVPKVAAFAAEALTDAAAGGQLPWEGVLAVLGLPEACWRLPGCEAVRAAAVKQLQQELGDLEIAWNRTQTVVRLLGLPLAVLKQLLSDDATRLDSEDTVVYSIERWLRQRWDNLDDVPEETLDALVEVVRLPQCTASYIASAVAEEEDHHWLSWAYDPSDLTIACRVAATTSLWCCKWAYRLPAWSLPERPASSISSNYVGQILVEGTLEFDWELPLSKAQDLIMEGKEQKDGEEVLLDGPEVLLWQGRRWGLQAAFTNKGIGLFVTVQQDRMSALTMAVMNVGINRGHTSWRGGYDPVLVEGAWARYGDASLIFFTHHQRDWTSIQTMLASCGFPRNSKKPDGGQVLHLLGKISHVS